MATVLDWGDFASQGTFGRFLETFLAVRTGKGGWLILAFDKMLRTIKIIQPKMLVQKWRKPSFMEKFLKRVKYTFNMAAFRFSYINHMINWNFKNIYNLYHCLYLTEKKNIYLDDLFSWSSLWIVCWTVNSFLRVRRKNSFCVVLSVGLL